MLRTYGCPRKKLQCDFWGRGQNQKVQIEAKKWRWQTGSHLRDVNQRGVLSPLSATDLLGCGLRKANLRLLAIVTVEQGTMIHRHFQTSTQRVAGWLAARRQLLRSFFPTMDWWGRWIWMTATVQLYSYSMKRRATAGPQTNTGSDVHPNIKKAELMKQRIPIIVITQNCDIICNV